LSVNIINVNREFESLKASLITVTGDAESAAVAFKGLQDFAATTPFSVQELTDAFIKLGNLGLAPSERALTSFGNTAGAMGKSLNQMIEAVADATTGEFERLKEFGIKTKTEGDRVTLTFKGVSTEIGKNSKEIQDYLINLGETDFAGGMERQASTLNGAFSNLGDSWDGFVDNLLSDENSGKIVTAVRFVGESIDWLNQKLASDSPIQALSEQLRIEQKMLDGLANDYNRPRLLRINPLISTKELGERFDEQRAKVDTLRDQLSSMMIVASSTAPTFDDIANSLGKVGSAGGIAFKSMHDGLSLSDEVLSSLNDEIDDYASKNEAIATSYNSIMDSLSNQIDMMHVGAREAAIFQAQLQLSADATDNMRQNVSKLAGELYDEQKALEDINDTAKDHEEQMKRMDRAARDWGSSFADAMVDSDSSLSDFVENALKQLQKIAIQQATQPIFSAFGSFMSDGLKDLFSFDGGGFTGSGARSGGVDGKGGFPAILHPNETVTDHTKGQSSGGGNISISVQVDASGSQTGGDQQGAALGQLIGMKIRDVLIQEKRQGGLLA